MHLPTHIEINPNVMLGKPCLQGTRIPVHVILQKLAGGETTDEIVAAYPQLNATHIHSCLLYAATLASEEIVIANV